MNIGKADSSFLTSTQIDTQSTQKIAEPAIKAETETLISQDDAVTISEEAKQLLESESSAITADSGGGGVEPPKTNSTSTTLSGGGGVEPPKSGVVLTPLSGGGGVEPPKSGDKTQN